MVPNPPPDQSSTEPHATPSMGTVFRLLSRERRRIVLETLVEHREVGMADLAEVVASEEQDVPFTELDEDDVLEVYTSLWHTDIPKLVDGGLVNYDQEHDLVAIAPVADEIDGFIF